ncbi:pyridoxal phosphate-dependent aminotransferase [Puia sp.]|uniref:pyridoxal phosphate-dependent aminotransferase n=1 Tax=Puia sp. TaxID=2045100 RepID=UPI002F42BEA1
MIDGHGDDGWKYGATIRADFSSNVVYGGLDAGLREQLRGVIDAVTHYPEAGALSLQTAAAAAYGVSVDSALVTNGATEAIYLIAQAFRERRATIVGPTFAEYGDACALQGIEVRQAGWEELRIASGLELRSALRVESPVARPGGLVFICNPNNPTGQALGAEELLGVVDAWPGTVFAVDESYIEFSLAADSLIAAGRPNVLVLRSLTKSCRIPGLRVGFVTGPPELVARVAACKMPWSVNRLAIEAGLYIFRHREEFAVPVESLLAATARWRRELAEVTGWRVWATDTHYFLMETPSAFSAAKLKAHLVTRYGLLIRDAVNFKGLGPQHFRLACQAPEQNELLTEALRECSRAGI